MKRRYIHISRLYDYCQALRRELQPKTISFWWKIRINHITTPTILLVRCGPRFHTTSTLLLESTSIQKITSLISMSTSFKACKEFSVEEDLKMICKALVIVSVRFRSDKLVTSIKLTIPLEAQTCKSNNAPLRSPSTCRAKELIAFSSYWISSCWQTHCKAWAIVRYCNLL